MQSIPVLTPFEEQVMQMYRHIVCGDEHVLRGVFSGSIHRWGQATYGSTWGGQHLITLNGYPAFPTVDAAVGRLSRKGLLQRQERIYAPPNSQRAKWILTPLGSDLLGLS